MNEPCCREIAVLASNISESHCYQQYCICLVWLQVTPVQMKLMRDTVWMDVWLSVSFQRVALLVPLYAQSQTVIIIYV